MAFNTVALCHRCCRVSTFLLEIGTEELPADFARLALPQLEQLVRRDLAEARLAHGAVTVTSTPRRLALTVEQLPESQPDLQEERKGPPAAQAFKDGVPTPAAIGFARRCGLEPEALAVRETPKGPFVFATVLEQGRATTAVLAELIPVWIASLQGRRFMRWGEGESRFSRPVRWLVALLDQEVIPVSLSDCDPPVHSGRLSRGHRLTPEPVVIPSAAAYGSALAAADVHVERSARGAAIRDQLQGAAARRGAHLEMPSALFEELVDLVESPQVVEGDVEASFLSLPPEVLSTVMRVHQRYVPLLRPDAPFDPLALSAQGVLFPHFLFVSNGNPEAQATVKRGNERVLRARLADAVFFLQADHGLASIDRREALSRVTFADGLGSLRDRTERLEWCTDVLLEGLHLNDDVAHASRRAAHLCKHDLVSQMVGEFPELQGIMGGKYLLAEGESRAVALAVLEHYRPRGAGDPLPESSAGALLALAERLELLLSIFSKGERPSGSSDPYGLRRAGNGILQILWHFQWQLDLASFLDRGGNHWADLFPEFQLDPGSFAHELAELLRQRLVSLLEEDGFDQDIVQAVAGGDLPDHRRLLLDVCDAKQRIELLQNLRQREELSPIQAVVQRASRLAEKGEVPKDVYEPNDVVNPNLFEKESEADLYRVTQHLAPLAQTSKRYGDLAKALAESSQILASFFDGPQSVLVICEDLEKRNNRLNLLGVFRNQASILADFSRLEG